MYTMLQIWYRYGNGSTYGFTGRENAVQVITQMYSSMRIEVYVEDEPPIRSDRADWGLGPDMLSFKLEEILILGIMP